MKNPKFVIIISGLPGSGKTTLVKEFTTHFTERMAYLPKAVEHIFSSQSNIPSSKLVVLDDPKDGIKAVKRAFDKKEGEILIISDPRLYLYKAATNLAKVLTEKLNKNTSVVWIEFECKEEKAIYNCKLRALKGGHKVSEVEIRKFAKERIKTNNVILLELRNIFRSANLPLYFCQVPITSEAALSTTEEVTELKEVVKNSNLYLYPLNQKQEYGEKYREPFFLSRQWGMGGMSGGSCWGDEASGYTGEVKPDFEEFEKLVLLLQPDISFSAMKTLKEKCVKEYFWTDAGYYGNYSEQGIMYTDIRDLALCMSELKLFP